MSTVLIQFDDDNLTPDNVNANFEAPAAAVNGLNGEVVLTVGAAEQGGSLAFVPVTGGRFLGQITAPSLLIGPPAGTQKPVLTQGDSATAIANLEQTIAGAYTPAQVQALSNKLDELLDKLRTAGFLSA